MTYVYIISINGDDRFCKVGISDDPEKRLASLQAGSHCKLALRETYWLESRSRAAWIERLFHDDHAEVRMNSEWFGVPFEEANHWLFEKVDLPGIHALRGSVQ